MDQRQNCKTMNEAGIDSALLVNGVPKSIASSNSTKRDFHSTHNSNSVILHNIVNNPHISMFNYILWRVYLWLGRWNH